MAAAGPVRTKGAARARAARVVFSIGVLWSTVGAGIDGLDHATERHDHDTLSGAGGRDCAISVDPRQAGPSRAATSRSLPASATCSVPASATAGNRWRQPCASIATSPTSRPFEVTRKRRKSFPSETRVKRGQRFVHGDVELIEKLGRNAPCPCGSGRRFQGMLQALRPLAV
ncbi:SEC-C metal-binding domain-containing protein [Bauldia sp.]|uniref:SEC-C metal-binding domain-containing protein n=1 Tax=Bauldia sp. TaxID=2575872 RepID=UPI003BAB6975